MSALPAAQSALEPSYIFEGREITTPVVTDRAVSCTALYLVSTHAAQRLVTLRDLKPAEILPGRTAFCLNFTKYIESDLGKHCEVSMDFLVHKADESRGLPYVGDMIGLLKSSLPSFVYKRVTNQAFAAGAECGIWGFPAALGQVSAQPVGTRYQGKLVLDGQHVLTFSVPFGGKSVVPAIERRIYSHVGGELCETISAKSAEKTGVHFGGARLILGNHPLADELRSLGLPKRALASVWKGLLRSKVEAPFPI
jgi:hypothetical protein